MTEQTATTQTTEATESAPSVLAGDTAPQPSFSESLPEDLRSDPSLAKFKDVDSLARSYVSAQRMIGADKIAVPTKHATEDDWRGVFRKLGLPETVDKYDVAAPKGVDMKEEFLNEFKQVAHKAGVLPRQAVDMLNWYSGLVSKDQELRVQARAQNQEKVKQTLKQEWGVAYDQKLKDAQRAVDELGGEQLRAKLDATGWGDDPDLIKIFAGMGGMLKEHSIKGSSDGDFKFTPQQASKNVEKLMADPAYWDRKHPNHSAAVAEVTRLMQQAHPSS